MGGLDVTVKADLEEKVRASWRCEPLPVHMKRLGVCKEHSRTDR